MALLYCDGFDHYGDGGGSLDLIEGGWIGSPNSPSTLNISAKTSAVPIASGQGVLRGQGATIWRSIAADPTKIVTELVIGFALYITDYASFTSQQRDLVNLLNANGTTTGQDVQATLRITGGGQLRVNLPNSVSVQYTGTDVLSPGVWYYIEWHWKYGSGTSGMFEVRIDGVTANGLNRTGINTAASTGQPNVKFFQLMDSGFSTVNNGICYMDDLYVCDTSGSVNNTFLGPIRVNTLAPDGDTGSQDWAPTPVGTAFDKINGLAPDDDSTYITATANGNTSEFTLEDLDPAVTTVYGMMTFHRARRTDVGTAKMKMSIKQGSDVVDGAERQPAQSYRNVYDVHELDPTSGSPFTVSDINSLNIQFTRTS